MEEHAAAFGWDVFRFSLNPDQLSIRLSLLLNKYSVAETKHTFASGPLKFLL